MQNTKGGGIKLHCLISFLFLLCLVNGGNISAQTPIFVETFGQTQPGFCDQGTLADGFVSAVGTWTVMNVGLNDSAANEWYISATEPGLPFGSCATRGCHVNGSYTNRTLHIGNVPNSPNANVLCITGDCGAIYDPGGFQTSVQTNKRAVSPPFSIPGNSTNILVFNYLEFGDSPNDSDNVLIDFFDGNVWTPAIADPPRTVTACGTNSVQWERYSVTLPVIPATGNVQIGFRWMNNNGGVGANPSFAADSIIVFTLPPPVANITASDTVLCVNDCIDFFADSAGPVAQYTWTFQGANIPNSPQKDPVGICYPNPGTYSVELVVSSPSGTDTAYASIVVNPCSPPVADFYASDTVFCERSCINFFDLSINGATGWNWYFPGGIPSTSTAPSPPPVCYSTPGFYDVTLIAFNQFGSDTMIKTAYLNVDTCPLPIANFYSVPVQFCPQHCVAFTDSSQYGPITSYQWSFPGGNPDTSSASSPVVCYNQEGMYDVELIVTNQYGSDTIVKYSEVSAQFVNNAFASPDTEMFFGTSYQMLASGGVSYIWSPSAGLDSTTIPNPVATPTQTTAYTVSITDAAGCVAYRQVLVTILHNNFVFVPNSFSPNGDGANDILYVRANNLYGVRFTVFDRWGEKIFESTDGSQGWNGMYKGKELDPGVFTYVVTVNYNDKQSTTQTGSVTLIR